MSKYLIYFLIPVVFFSIFVLDNIVVSGPETKKMTCTNSDLLQQNEYECYVNVTTFGKPFKSKTEYEILTPYSKSDGSIGYTTTGKKITAEYGAPEVAYILAERPNTQYGGLVISPNSFILVGIYILCLLLGMFFSHIKNKKDKKRGDIKIDTFTYGK